jgi:hypothetical protein
MPSGFLAMYWNLASYTLLISFFIYLPGCTNQKSITQPRAPGVAVVSSSGWVFEWGEGDEAEVDPHICLAKGLSARNVDIIHQDEFLATAFPNMAPDKAPRTPEYLELALKHPEVRQRVANRGIEYLVYVTGKIDYENAAWTGGCAAGPPVGGGCWYYGEVDKTSLLNAVVIDTHLAQQFNEQSTENSGKDWAAILGIVPVWHVSDPRHGACIEMANNIYQMLRTESRHWKINTVLQVETAK